MDLYELYTRGVDLYSIVKRNKEYIQSYILSLYSDTPYTKLLTYIHDYIAGDTTDATGIEEYVDKLHLPGRHTYTSALAWNIEFLHELFHELHTFDQDPIIKLISSQYNILDSIPDDPLDMKLYTRDFNYCWTYIGLQPIEFTDSMLYVMWYSEGLHPYGDTAVLYYASLREYNLCDRLLDYMAAYIDGDKELMNSIDDYIFEMLCLI